MKLRVAKSYDLAVSSVKNLVLIRNEGTLDDHPYNKHEDKSYNQGKPEEAKAPQIQSNAIKTMLNV